MDTSAGPAHWLASVARAAAEGGLQGIALMDHLIQIPQVGSGLGADSGAVGDVGMLAWLESWPSPGARW